MCRPVSNCIDNNKLTEDLQLNELNKNGEMRVTGRVTRPSKWRVTMPIVWLVVVVVVLLDPFRGMGACRNSAETQQLGHTPRFGP